MEAEARGEKPCIKLPSSVVASEMDILLVMDFNRDEFLCVFFWCTLAGDSQRGTFYWVDLK
jgi:hypothetical protein